MEAFPPLVCGNRAFMEKDYPVAIKHYTEALEEDDENVDALCNRSAAYCEMELFKTAFKDAEAALAVAPDNARAIFRKASALEGLGRKKEASEIMVNALLHVGGDLEVYKDLVAKLSGAPVRPHPAPSSPAPATTPPPSSSPSAHKSSAPAAAAAAAAAPRAAKQGAASKPSPAPKVATAAAVSSHSTAAAASANATAPATRPVPVKVTKIDDEDEDFDGPVSRRGGQGDSGLTLSAASRAGVDAQNPSHVAAIAAAENMIAHGIGDVPVDQQIALGYMQVNTGKYKQGQAIFNKLLEQQPKLVAAFLGRGTAQALQGNLAAAAKDFSAAIDADKTCADAWKRRGQTRAALGFDAEAIKDLTKASEISADHECFHQRGIVYHKMHDYCRGLADFRKALDMMPNNHVTWNFVGLCENSLGKTREAIIAYKRATKLDPNFKEAWANLAQAYRDSGDRTNAELYFERAFSVDRNYTHGFHLRGLLYYGCGEIRLALNDFKRGWELDNTDRNCGLMRAVCLHSLGLLSQAVAAYTQILQQDPVHQCFYQRELCLYLHKTLDKDTAGYNTDVDLDPYFKEAYCKRHPTNHPRICNYSAQAGLSSSIPDVVLSDNVQYDAMKKIVELSRKFGPLIQLNTPGFLSNLRQHRMCGLAILQMAQQARAFWRQCPRKGPAKKGRGEPPAEPEGEFLYFDQKGSSKENGKAHELSWRDFIDIAVKWRQVSEPNDPVFWIDLLAPEAFAEGFGLQTPMVTGQMKVVRYHPYFNRALEVVKKLIVDSGACNVHDQRFMLPRNKLSQLQEAKSCEDMWEVMQQGFYVETPCHSNARTGKTMAGTRITLLQKQPDGFDFTIRTPGTPPRWVEMDVEMTHVWRQLATEARKKDGPDLDKFTELALTFYFYYVNFGPLSRGTAATGYIAFFALMLSVGFEVHCSPPKGTQVDWPAILSPTPMDFIIEVKKWIYPARKKTTTLDECPTLAHHIATARRMTEALNAV